MKKSRKSFTNNRAVISEKERIQAVNHLRRMGGNLPPGFRWADDSRGTHKKTSKLTTPLRLAPWPSCDLKPRSACAKQGPVDEVFKLVPPTKLIDTRRRCAAHLIWHRLDFYRQEQDAGLNETKTNREQVHAISMLMEKLQLRLAKLPAKRCDDIAIAQNRAGKFLVLLPPTTDEIRDFRDSLKTFAEKFDVYRLSYPNERYDLGWLSKQGPSDFYMNDLVADLAAILQFFIKQPNHKLIAQLVGEFENLSNGAVKVRVNENRKRFNAYSRFLRIKLSPRKK